MGHALQLHVVAIPFLVLQRVVPEIYVGAHVILGQHSPVFPLPRPELRRQAPPRGQGELSGHGGRAGVPRVFVQPHPQLPSRELPLLHGQLSRGRVAHVHIVHLLASEGAVRSPSLGQEEVLLRV